MKWFSFLFVFLLWQASAVQNYQPVNYHPRQLKNTLNNLYGNVEYKLDEISVLNQNVDDDSINGKFFQINIDNKSFGYVYIGRVYSCRVGVCIISDGKSRNPASEYFDYFIVFDSNVVVKNVMVYNYMATHGHEITARGWLRQFVGYKYGEYLLLGKNVDAISGATVSVTGIMFDIEYRTKLLSKLLFPD